MGSYRFDLSNYNTNKKIKKMKLFAAVALFGFAAIKASPIPDGLFAENNADDCEDIIEPAALPEIDAPFEDMQAPAEPDCEGEAIEEESILDIVPAFIEESQAYDIDEECEDEAPATEAPEPVVMKEDPPCYDDDADNNEPVEKIETAMKDYPAGINPLAFEGEEGDYYDEDEEFY